MLVKVVHWPFRSSKVPSLATVRQTRLPASRMASCRGSSILAFARRGSDYVARNLVQRSGAILPRTLSSVFNVWSVMSGQASQALGS